MNVNKFISERGMRGSRYHPQEVGEGPQGAALPQDDFYSRNYWIYSEIGAGGFTMLVGLI